MEASVRTGRHEEAHTVFGALEGSRNLEHRPGRKRSLRDAAACSQVAAKPSMSSKQRFDCTGIAAVHSTMQGHEVAISRYRELARGQILGDTYGMLKLLVSPDDGTVLGVHVLGTNATEVVHIGQAVMGFGGTVDYLVDAVFNYPTLAESYKVAALDAKNKLLAIERLSR